MLLRMFSSKAGVLTTQSRIAKLTLFTGTDCQLCEVAKSILVDLKQTKKVEFELVEYDIRNEDLKDVQKWRRAYQYDIPVLHLNGKEIARHRLDRDKVEESIRASAVD